MTIASSISFIQDTNAAVTTGTFNITTAPYTFSVSSAEKIRIDSNGFLLVNTATSYGSYALQVNGNAYFNGSITFTTATFSTLNAVASTATLAQTLVIAADPGSTTAIYPTYVTTGTGNLSLKTYAAGPYYIPSTNSLYAGTIYTNGYAVSTASSLTFQYNNAALGTAATINFATGTTATITGGVITVQATGGGGSFTGGTVTGTTQFTNTASSTSTTTGALTVTGGVGIGGSLYVGGALVTSGATGNITGANLISAVNIAASSGIIVTGTATSTSTQTGAITVAGGVGIGGTLYVGGSIVSTNTASNNITGVNLLSASNIVAGSTVQVLGGVASTSTATGSLKVLGGVGISGALYAGGAANALSFNSTSDENKKTNITIIADAIDIIEQLKGVRFTWRDSGAASAGLIAQDVQTVLPELIGVDNGTLNLNYSGIIGVLVEAVKELSARVKQLEGQ